MTSKSHPPFDSDAGASWLVAAVWAMLIAFVGLLGLGAWLLLPQTSPTTPTPLADAAAATPGPTYEPLQIALPPTEPITFTYPTHTWELRPRASYQISGRVLSTHTYTSDWMADLAPLDLAVGWGELNNNYLDFFIRWSQHDRFLYYTWSGDLPVTPEHLNAHIANIHIIPTNDNLRQTLAQLQTNDQVQLEGLLVDITKSENGHPIPQTLNTSLSRTDEGAGSCEILYVQSLVVNNFEYR